MILGTERKSRVESKNLQQTNKKLTKLTYPNSISIDIDQGIDH